MKKLKANKNKKKFYHHCIPQYGWDPMKDGKYSNILAKKINIKNNYLKTGF